MSAPAIAIAITGASGSGKTSLATELCQNLRIAFPSLGTTLLGEDSYYRDLGHFTLGQRKQVNFDHPAALEHELLLTQVRKLKAGMAVEVPNYDYALHTRHDHTSRLEAKDILIVEGILLLSHSGLRREFDLRLFIETPLDLCLSRRIQRDCTERGRSVDSVRHQFAATVEPMYHRHVAPTRDYAHMILPGEISPQKLSKRVMAELDNRGYLKASQQRKS